MTAFFFFFDTPTTITTHRSPKWDEFGGGDAPITNDKVSFIGLTIENIGFVTVVEFQSRVSVNGSDWERLSKLDLQRTFRRSI